MHHHGSGASSSPPPSPRAMRRTSRSNVSSSFHSGRSDDGSFLDQEVSSHFEDIGLDDDTAASFSSRHGQGPAGGPTSSRTRAAPGLRDAPLPFSRSASTPASSGQGSSSTTEQRYKMNAAASTSSLSLTGAGDDGAARTSRQSTKALLPLALPQRIRRSGAPSLTVSTSHSAESTKLRRSSWQAGHARKSTAELEKECDDDDGDDIPADMVLDNVPISPRPPQDRFPNRSSSLSPTPDRARQKERVRSMGNGTPSVAQARGSLKSPQWKSETFLVAGGGPLGVPKTRANSWNAAMADLSSETKMLTEKLEEHAASSGQEEYVPPAGQLQKSSTWGSSAASNGHMPAEPQLSARSVNPMIDPLPVSKEKEAVLSRTRPSWLPPKDPAEERRHVKEFQRMMARSAEADRRRQASKSALETRRDISADSLMREWEDGILPRWDAAMRERRTRQLWWKGVPSRCRAMVWVRAIGNGLELTETSYLAALARAQKAESRFLEGTADGQETSQAAWFKAIREDIAREARLDYRLFLSGGPLHESLQNVLCAYTVYRSDIGYVPGCHAIAALLLLNLPTPASAFVALANLLNRALPLGFYAEDAVTTATAYNLALQMLSKKSPALHAHLTSDLAHVEPEAYLRDVFVSLFAAHVEVDEASRLWDIYVFEGDTILIRAAVALLLDREMPLLGARTREEVRHVISGRQGAGKRDSGDAEERWIEAVGSVGK